MRVRPGSLIEEWASVIVPPAAVEVPSPLTVWGPQRPAVTKMVIVPPAVGGERQRIL